MTFMEDVRMMAKDMDEKERKEFLSMAEQIDREEDEADKSAWSKSPYQCSRGAFRSYL
jgi:hypothetical protein